MSAGRVKLMMVSLMLLLGQFVWQEKVFAAPCYGIVLPSKKEAIWSLDTHFLLRRNLEAESGKVRSSQYFLNLSYGLWDGFSLDLKAGAGDIRYEDAQGAKINYPASFSGGYGFRLRLWQYKGLNLVGGFQHISVHPRSRHKDGLRHRAVLDDWQGSLLLGYNQQPFSPYIGIKVSRTDYIHWQDKQRKRIMSDLTKTIGLVAGFNFSYHKKINLTLEGQWLDSKAVAFSFGCQF